jgi:hypothetical protein
MKKYLGSPVGLVLKTKAQCVVCGKVTAIRQPYGEGTAMLPRRHKVDGIPCDGNVREAALVEVYVRNRRRK